MSPQNKAGYLEIILGPMYASKTTRLIEIYKQYRFCDIPVTAINHSLDNRYHDEFMSTHDKINIPCIKTDKLKTLWKNTNLEILEKSKVILINEGQFFNDLSEIVTEMIDKGKHIYICGLDGDFERKKFGQILDLIPLCDKVTKLTSLCSICKDGTPGIFSMRLTDETEQTVVGHQNYIPVCRSCYISKNKH